MIIIRIPAGLNGPLISREIVEIPKFPSCAQVSDRETKSALIRSLRRVNQAPRVKLYKDIESSSNSALDNKISLRPRSCLRAFRNETRTRAHYFILTGYIVIPAIRDDSLGAITHLPYNFVEILRGAAIRFSRAIYFTGGRKMTQRVSRVAEWIAARPCFKQM